MTQLHVIGAGLAGLSAALSLTAAGRSVIVHEAGSAAGGRCRSYFDKELGFRIDNGNHLLLSGNTAARGYIAETGARSQFAIPRYAIFPFMDIISRDRWQISVNRGRIPWWVMRARHRVPNTRLADYWAMARIARIRDNTVVADSMRRGRLYWRLLEPLAIAALNTPSQDGLARLLATVMRETLLRGGNACLPMLPRDGLSEALIDPALAALKARGAEIRFNSRITAITVQDHVVTALKTPDAVIPLGPGSGVIAAVPPWIAGDLLPDLIVPTAFQAILNIHFDHQANPGGPLDEAGFIGLTGGTAEWVFLKPNHVSVTISAANRMVDEPARSIAAQVWSDVADALGLPAGARNQLPPFRVVKEKRATFAATAAQDLRRPTARTGIAGNLALAGDWTATGLPATIEGAIRSGRTAAAVLLSP